MKKGIDKRTFIKNLLIAIFVISFFVAITLTYYNMLVEEKRGSIINNGEMGALQAEMQFNEYLSTSVDAIKLTAYTLDGMLEAGASDAEIQSYLVGQSVAVKNAILENSTGIYA